MTLSGIETELGARARFLVGLYCPEVDVPGKRGTAVERSDV